MAVQVVFADGVGSQDVNPTQSDFNHDGEGDICDLNDGLIYVYATDTNYREWQAEAGYSSWNSYRGALEVLRSTGQYTQVPGSNPLVPNPGEVAFNLVTGVAAGVESSLGTNSAGAPRANATLVQDERDHSTSSELGSRAPPPETGRVLDRLQSDVAAVA